MQDDLTSEPSDIGKSSNFSVMLHPHRSLSPRGFLILMSFIGGVSFLTGLGFLLMGAWPVLGFFGLDVLLIYIAFRMNFKSGRQCEIIELSEGRLKVRFISQDGVEKSQDFEAYWLRFEVVESRLVLRCQRETLELGRFLIEEEKNEVRDIVTSALYRYRHGAAG